MEKEKSINIEVPNGYEIDKEKSTFEKIVFKKKLESWRSKEDDTSAESITGYIIDKNSSVNFVTCRHAIENRNIFNNRKQAKSALAMAQISQIMANDERFGGSIIDDEWKDRRMVKYIIYRQSNWFELSTRWLEYNFLAFHTDKQRDLFLKENEDLVRDYLMID